MNFVSLLTPTPHTHT